MPDCAGRRRPARRVRDAARAAVSAMTGGDDKLDADKRQAAAAVKEVFDIAERMAALTELRRGLGDRTRAVRPRAPGGAAVGRRADAQAGLRRADHGPDLGHPEAGRRLHRHRGRRRAAGGRAGRRLAEPATGRDGRRHGKAAEDAGSRTTTTGRCRGAAWTSAHRSTTAGRASSTWPDRCRRRAATGCPRRRWPRSPSWSGPPAGGRSACSPPAARPRRRPCTSASSCRS